MGFYNKKKNIHFYRMEFASFFSFSEKYTICAINWLNCCLWHTIFHHKPVHKDKRMKKTWENLCGDI